MRLSTRGQYGIRLLLDLALHWGEGPVRLKYIAQRQELPLLYIENLIAPLIAGHVVKSTRGPSGGVSLYKNPKKIKLSEAIELLEGHIAPVECVNNPEAYPHSDNCAIRDIWIEVRNATHRVLDSITLQDLIERQKSKWKSKQLANNQVN